jgi:hypothetical protein
MLIITSVKNHLEFLGYEIRIEDAVCYATNPQKTNFSFYELNGILYFLKGVYSQEDAKEMRTDFLEFLNRINRLTCVTRFILTSEFDVMASATHLGGYEKITFGRFHDLWISDLKSLFDDDEASDFL